MDPTFAGQLPGFVSNAPITAPPVPRDADTQSTLSSAPSGTTTSTTTSTTAAHFTNKNVSAAPCSIPTFEQLPECLLCRMQIPYEEISLADRNCRITYCPFNHTYHDHCVTEYYTLYPDHAPRKNPDLKCFVCSSPMPLSMPVWDGEAFICPIRKSELDALTPYVGAPMTFSLADFPMIGAREVTVALGFKGAPVIRLLDTSQKPQAEAPTRGDYVFCLCDQLVIISQDSEDAKKTSVHNIIKYHLTLVAHILSGGSDALLQELLKVIHENLQKHLDVDENTRPFHMVIKDSNNKNLLTFAINYPTYPLEWCKPATQLVCLKNKEGTSGSRPIPSSDSAQFESRKRALIDGPDTELPPRKRKNTEPPVSENRTGQLLEENTIPQLDRLSFELSVTAPGSKDSLAFFNDMNFRYSRSIRSVFDNDWSPSHDLLDSPQYAKFKTDFQNAFSKIREDEELWVRVKLKKPSDLTKNQDTGPPPAETPLDEARQQLISDVLSALGIIGRSSKTDPNSE